MIKSLYTAATGMEAQSNNIERISNDIANANTDGFKRGRTEFNDLMYETIKEPGAQIGATSQTPVGIQTGLGVKVGASHKIFEQGPAKQTGNDLDIMIEGEGFFPVQKANGEIGYTRTGAFHRDNTGRVRMSNGASLIPPINIPANTIDLKIIPNGEVIAIMPDHTETTLGQIQLVTFVNQDGLAGTGDGIYRTTLASGAPLQGIPGENGLGSVQQGFLEASNVNIATSMVEMIQTQRAYEANAKVLTTADQMLQATNNVR